MYFSTLKLLVRRYTDAGNEIEIGGLHLKSSSNWGKMFAMTSH